jgi:hypothetical protein
MKNKRYLKRKIEIHRENSSSEDLVWDENFDIICFSQNNKSTQTDFESSKTKKIHNNKIKLFFFFFLLV